jgi:hypothetical protein
MEPEILLNHVQSSPPLVYTLSQINPLYIPCPTTLTSASTFSSPVSLCPLLFVRLSNCIQHVNKYRSKGCSAVTTKCKGSWDVTLYNSANINISDGCIASVFTVEE